jgi:cardiolipin synthase
MIAALLAARLGRSRLGRAWRFVREDEELEDYRANSRLLTLEEWLRRPRREKVFDNLMRLTSALM